MGMTGKPQTLQQRRILAMQFENVSTLLKRFQTVSNKFFQLRKLVKITILDMSVIKISRCTFVTACIVSSPPKRFTSDAAIGSWLCLVCQRERESEGGQSDHIWFQQSYFGPFRYFFFLRARCLSAGLRS